MSKNKIAGVMIFDGLPRTDVVDILRGAYNFAANMVPQNEIDNERAFEVMGDLERVLKAAGEWQD